jgi:molybdopterin-containing oxidoreductase family membrane subunit
MAASTEPAEVPVLGPGQTYATVTDRVSSVVLSKKTPKGWLLGFGIAFLVLMVMLFSLTVLFAKGVGVWGLNNTVAWGFAIVNFVWWVGIGHAGTLISAILLLFRQEWRNSINRFAEAMTIFAVANAGLFPIIHTGRPWLAYWLFPYPSMFQLWPQFRSPLLWDVFAITTYVTISLLFWYVGLIPDFATLRDMADNKVVRRVYGLFALGWRGAARHWAQYNRAALLLAALATPLVVSVHSVVSFDFAVSSVPGWHTTFLPPYFVSGAIFSGFAMVMTLAIPIRKFYHMEDFITDRHLENMAKVMLATGLIVFYAYIMEVFFAWYSGNEYEKFMIYNRMTGPYAPYYWSLIFFNGVMPQLLWFKKVRRTTWILFLISIGVNIGMWLERFIIVVTSLHREYLPSTWAHYAGTFWDWTLYIGTLGFFFSLLFLFLRVLPMINMFEMKELVHHLSHRGKEH